MKLKISAFLRSSVFRYLITGGIGFAFELLVIVVAVRGFGASSVLSVAVSFWVGIAASFLMQKLFTFRDRRRTTAAISRQGLAYAVLVAVNYFFTLGFVAIADPIWHSVELERAVALIITTAWNYLAYRFIIFK